jgi:hypothetical protein
MPTGVPQRGRPRTEPPAPSHLATARARPQDHGRQRDLGIALDRAIEVVIVPVAGVGRVLSARTGLVRYARRGALAGADLMAWPVAAATELGHAVLTRWGPLRQPPAARRAPAARSGPPDGRKPAVRSKPAAGRKPAVRSKSPAGRKPAAARARSGG